MTDQKPKTLDDYPPALVELAVDLIARIKNIHPTAVQRTTPPRFDGGKVVWTVTWTIAHVLEKLEQLEESGVAPDFLARRVTDLIALVDGKHPATVHRAADLSPAGRTFAYVLEKLEALVDAPDEPAPPKIGRDLEDQLVARVAVTRPTAGLPFGVTLHDSNLLDVHELRVAGELAGLFPTVDLAFDAADRIDAALRRLGTEARR